MVYVCRTEGGSWKMKVSLSTPASAWTKQLPTKERSRVWKEDGGSLAGTGSFLASTRQERSGGRQGANNNSLPGLERQPVEPEGTGRVQRAMERVGPDHSPPAPANPWHLEKRPKRPQGRWHSLLTGLHQENQARAIGFETTELWRQSSGTVAGHTDAQVDSLPGSIGRIESAIGR